MPRRLTENPKADKRRRKTEIKAPTGRRGALSGDAGKKSVSKPLEDYKKDANPKRTKVLFDIKNQGPQHVGESDKTTLPTFKANKRASHAKRIGKKPIKDKDKKKAYEAAKAKRDATKKPYRAAITNAEPLKKTYEAPKLIKEPLKKTYDAPKAKKESINKNKVSAEIRNNFIKLAVMVVVGVGIIIGIYYGIQAILEKQIGFNTVQKSEIVTPISTQVPRDRNQQDNIVALDAMETPNPAIVRDISYGSRDIEFKERQINIPGIYDNELLFSAGTGSLYVGGNVLSKLYLYNLDADDETLIAESKIYAGEYYETQVNHSWLVWLETDHGIKNYIMVMNRSTGKISKMQSFKSGQPKLKLYGDLLVWMEQVSDTEDRLSMIDLEVQEFLPLHTFSDKATYGVSAPCVYESTIVWADRDPMQTEDDKATSGEKSAIYYLELETDESGAFSDPKYYQPGTYVHEPLYNGDVFVWLDANKSPQSNLYIGRVGQEPIKIATGVTTYSIGDGIVVYGKDQAVWVYVIDTQELCRLTSPGEMGMLPAVTERTVVWYNLTADSEKDVLRFKILTDEELYPGGIN